MQDHIGFDPVKWIDRLMDVNERSQFTPRQQATIAAGLMKIRGELERSEPSEVTVRRMRSEEWR